MNAKEVAIKMMSESSIERLESEKMMGVKFADMAMEQRRLAAACIAAFYDEVCKKYGK